MNRGARSSEVVILTNKKYLKVNIIKQDGTRSWQF